MAIKVTGTLDIECANWTDFVVAATYSPHLGVHVHRSMVDLVDYLRDVRGTWWAHYGGAYDFLGVAEVQRTNHRKAQLDVARSRISRCVSGGFELRDSYGLVPLALDVAAEMTDERAPRLPWGCICGKACGGYCQIHHNMKSGDPDLDAYCVADCRVLYKVLMRVIEVAEELDLDLKGTLGGTAWTTAQRKLRLPDVPYEWQTWDRISEANYGGRDIIARPLAHGVTGAHWDISSAYPAALARGELPVGEPAELGERQALLALAADSPGVYECSVLVPDDLDVPPLPWRSPRGRVAFPVGLVRGTWCLPELLAAVERGCEIQHVHSGVVWTGERVIFEGLIAHWYEQRRKVGKRTALGEWIRALANSFTGTLSMRPERRTVRMHPAEIKVCPRTGRCARGCTGRCGAYVQLDAWGHVWAQPYFRLGPSSHVHWAAYLRAYCRLHLLEGVERTGADELVYSATDSIWTLSRLAPGRQGKALGAWEYQHGFTDWECRSKGIYRFVKDGEVVIRAAGAGRVSDEEWKAGIVHRTDGVLSIQEAAQEGRSLFQRRDKVFTLPAPNRTWAGAWYGDRRLDKGGRRTYPAPVSQHLEREVWASSMRSTRAKAPTASRRGNSTRTRKTARS